MQELLDAVDKPEDLRLIESLREGDATALEELMRRDGRSVRGTIYGVIGDLDQVDDVAQEVWLAVWRRASRLADADKWQGWLHRLAKNAAIDALRRRRSRSRLLERLKVLSGRRRESVPASRRLELEEEHRRVLNSIERLPDIYRQVFVLRHLENWSYRRIAEALSLAVDTVETRLVRARRFLREGLKDGSGR